jgi:hypothetical protein
MGGCCTSRSRPDLLYRADPYSTLTGKIYDPEEEEIRIAL